MDLNLIFPPDAMAWLNRYGLFCVVVFFGVLVLAMALRPFWMWYSGKTEVLDHLRRVEADQRRALTELEVLNQTLSIPVKKAAQRAKQTAPAEEVPLIVTQETKEGFLKALAESRNKLG